MLCSIRDEKGKVGFAKYSMLLLLAVAFIAGLWLFGSSIFKGVTKWLLWALAALCVCAGVITLLDAEGRPLAYLGGLALWAFAAYAVRVAGGRGARAVGIIYSWRVKKLDDVHKLLK